MNIKDIKNLDQDQILEALGLERERSLTSSIVWSLALIGIGALAGAGAALLLAPQTGSELRRSMGRKIKDTADDVLSTTRAKVDEAHSHIQKG